MSGNPPMSLTFAIPDHPWVDSADGAAVRIAMTVGQGGRHVGCLAIVKSERSSAADDSDDLVTSLVSKIGVINTDLSIGVDTTRALPMRANERLASVGMKTIGSAFQIDHARAVELGLGKVQGLERHIRPYFNGRDLSQTPRGIFVIDFYGMSEDEVRTRFPSAYQHLLHHAKPERDQNRNAIFREKWWVIGHPRQQFREATDGLDRYIATLETAKHRFFAFLSKDQTPDSSLLTVADSDALTLGVLSSEVHTMWALSAGGRLGVGNDPRYNKTLCFDPFPFPAADAEQSAHIAALAEQLDAHRKRQQAAHPGLTLTGMYNVLEALRSGTALSAKEKLIHEQGLVSVLRQLHDELDAAVLAAYGWSDLLADLRIAHGNDPAAEGDSAAEAKRRFEETVLERLVALNAERSAEEARGHIRWLRPDFQNPQATSSQTVLIDEDSTADAEEAAPAVVPAAAKPVAWPKDPLEQVRAVAEVLSASAVPLDIELVAARFSGRGPWKKRLPALLDMLVALGRARQTAAGYLAR